jgi:UDP:flavonoid glycosyltransferase YjiC (YdhE family)
MRVAFLTPHVPGHAYPMSSLARRLKSRGHDVVSIGIPDAAPFVSRRGDPIRSYCEKEYPAGSLREKRAQASRLQWQEALRFTHRTIVITYSVKQRGTREIGIRVAIPPCAGFEP